MIFAIKGALLALLVTTSLNVYAKKLINECQTIDVQINTIKLLDGVSVEMPLVANASDCLGAFEGNNSAFDKPIQNLGYDEDGWLNKEDYNAWWDGPGAFVNDVDLLDLDGDGAEDDPGWILVGKEEQSGFEGGVSSDGTLTYNHEQLVTLNHCKTGDEDNTSCFGGEAVKGQWVYTPPAQNPTGLLDLVGGDFFDQVAIIFKAGNAFAIYNFNVIDLGLDPALAGDYNFAFTGTWDISETLGSGLSNLSFWAKDPSVPSVQVPEPATLILMMMSGLFCFNRRNKA